MGAKRKDATRDPRRVLVLDGELTAALAIVRSLGRRGVTVDVGERSPDFLSSYSRFAGGVFVARRAPV